MHLLAKTPADRPASARAVVEAIGSIEREVQAERQRAELSPASPIPVAADAARRTPDGVAGGQGGPRDVGSPRPADARDHRRLPLCWGSPRAGDDRSAPSECRGDRARYLGCR